MKNVLYLLTISLAMATSAFAQNALLPRVAFGIKGGVNTTNLSTTNSVTDKSRVGYQAGAYSRISLGKFHLQPELYYTEKNTKILQSGQQFVNTVSLRSVDLPILFGYSWGGDAATGRIQTGPLVSFGTGNKQTDNAQQTINGLMVVDQNYAWLLGAGVDVGRLSFDARYEYGFKKMYVTDYRSSVKVNLFSLSVAYRLASL